MPGTKPEPRESMLASKKASRMARTTELYRLDALDLKICEIIFEHPMIGAREIAHLVEATLKQVRWRLTKPSVRKRLEQMNIKKTDLIEQAKLLGIRRLMQLARSSDEWLALQASKVLAAGELGGASVRLDPGAALVIYETQVGSQGQIIQSMRTLEAADPTKNPQGLPTVLDLMQDASGTHRVEGGA